MSKTPRQKREASCLFLLKRHRLAGAELPCDLRNLSDEDLEFYEQFLRHYYENGKDQSKEHYREACRRRYVRDYTAEYCKGLVSLQDNDLIDTITPEKFFELSEEIES